jgi:hypothetical protein
VLTVVPCLSWTFFSSFTFFGNNPIKLQNPHALSLAPFSSTKKKQIHILISLSLSHHSSLLNSTQVTTFFLSQSQLYFSFLSTHSDFSHFQFYFCFIQSVTRNCIWLLSIVSKIQDLKIQLRYELCFWIWGLISTLLCYGFVFSTLFWLTNWKLIILVMIVFSFVCVFHGFIVV